MSHVTVRHRVSNTEDSKENYHSQNREWSDWIDSQALKTIYSFVGSLWSFRTCSMGRILARVLQSTPAEFEDVDFKLVLHELNLISAR